MQLINKFKDTIKKYSMIADKDHILVALSGGADSVCLLTLLNNIKSEFNLKLSANYINHNIRLDEIPNEIEFCKNICEFLNIDFHTKSINIKNFIKEKKINKQESARQLRYKAIEETAVENKANKIAIGHNADDQAETMLINLIRGSGLTGLAGMAPIRKNIIRPLVEIQRKDIENFLKSEKINFLTDSSNLKNDYTRNKVRHLIMPEFKKLNPEIVEVLSRSSKIFREEEKYIDIIVTKTLMRLITRKADNFIELFLLPLESMNIVILRRLLRRAIDATMTLKGITFLHIEEIITLIKQGKSGDRIYLPSGIRIIKKYSTFVITNAKPAKLNTYYLDTNSQISLKEASIAIISKILQRDEADNLKDDKRIALINIDKIKFPLLVRSRQKGDFFYPMGFGKKKKIQDYFVDKKIPRDERDIVPIVVSDDNIVWVVGYRLDERYRIDDNTQRVLKLEIKPINI